MRSARPTRHSRLVRFAPLAVAASLLVAACGDAQETTDATNAGTAAEAAGTETTSVASGESESADAPRPTVAADVPPKPDVAIPEGNVTELTITDLTEGSGRPAEVGDTVVVHYVGVRSEDGTEFDNSYDRGEPFPVPLGQGRVIQGWDQGLIGAKAGGQRQLDIPADLAYGDSPSGDIIQAGDALTFVIDVLAVVPGAKAADKPQITMEGSENRGELEVIDLIEGDGAEITLGQTVYLQLIAYRSDTGEELLSTWEAGAPEAIPYVQEGALPGIFEGLAGMKVGGRRQLNIPFEDAFGAGGNSQLGLPEATDLTLVIDLVAAL